MLDAERKIGMELEKAIPEMVNAEGITRTAEDLGVSKATLGYWMLKFRMDYRRVVLLPGETLTITRKAN